MAKMASVAVRKPTPAEMREPLDEGTVATLGSQSLRDRAYEEIKRRIIRCELKPGAYVNEASLSAMLGIGKMPVHQALHRLMHEDLVEIIPRKGVIVKPVSLDNVLKMIEVRIVNEAFAVRLAAERASAAEVKALEEILAHGRRATDAHDVEEIMQTDQRFHFGLAEAANNPVLFDILRRLHEQSLRLWYISLRSLSQQADVEAQHQAILTAVAMRNPDAAEAAMRTHIGAFRYNLVQQL